MFTRRHDEKVAKTILDAQPNTLKDYWTRTFADMFEADNPSFNRQRFYSACRPNG